MLLNEIYKHDQSELEFGEKDGAITPAMDIFSLGCGILFTHNICNELSFYWTYNIN